MEDLRESRAHLPTAPGYDPPLNLNMTFMRRLSSMFAVDAVEPEDLAEAIEAARAPAAESGVVAAAFGEAVPPRTARTSGPRS
jgi:hypothetical protein